jgi:hypothetical protein
MLQFPMQSVHWTATNLTVLANLLKRRQQNWIFAALARNGNLRIESFLAMRQKQA